MAITLGKSLAAGNALRALDRGGGALQGIFERLASGQRINRAADDAAGLAVASGLNVRSRVYDQGIRNFNDGVSLLNVADGALEELTNIVTRIKELAVQSSNGVFSDTQRQSLDIEAQALADEFTRIVQSTSFNGRGLFNGELENGLTLQGGLGEAAAIFSSLGKDLGTGDFQADLSFSSSYGTTIVDVGDLNGDGILDMVSGGTNGISILIGSGDGTFTEIATGTLTTGSRTYRDIRLEDINGDGVLDITAVADRASVAYFSTALGNGDGTFEGLQESASASAQVYYDLNFADVNGDGIQDAIASGSRSGGSATFDIRLGNGDGTFQVAVSSSSGDSAIFESLILDYDGDGDLDILAIGGTAGNGVGRYYRNDGNGTFTGGSKVFGDLVYGFSGGDLADVNGDGNLDVVVAGSDRGGAAEISLYFGDGGGGFTLNSTFSIGDALVEDVNFADLNGDGILDMFASEGVDNILLGDGEGGFTPTQQSSGLGFGGLIAADLNQDGILDTVGAGEINFGIGREGLNPILEFSIATKADALQAISPLETKLKLLGQKQGQIGAFLSRLSSATNALEAQSLNSKEASNRILSADVAIESAALVRQQILQQSRTAILAQANQQYSIALSLLTPPLGSES